MEGLATNKKFKNAQAADQRKNKQDATGESEGKKMTRKERQEMKIMQHKNKKMGVENPIGSKKQFPRKSKQKAWGESKIKKNPGRGRKKF